MAASRTCQFWHVCFLQGMLVIVNFAVENDGLALDMRLTRKQITTSLGQPVNLGCYATSTTSSPLTYSWTKDNVTVTQSSNIKVYGNVLVVTPKKDQDFGTYVCHVSIGLSSTRCNISLRSGCNKTETGENPVVETGCVNLSVLMPVLAVMMVSILLNVHFVVQWRRRQQWLLSEEDFLQLQMAQEGTVVNHEKPEEEIVVKNKNKKCFGGLRKRRKENEEIGQLSDEKDDQEREKNKELIEMQEKVHIPRTQDNAQDGPPTQDTPLSLDSPREKGIPRLQEILRMPEISPIVVQESPRAQESARVPDSPRTLESPRAQDIPRLEDILHVQEVSPDSPRSLDSPRAQDIPRLEDFLRATDDEEHGGAAPVSMDADRRSAVIESPRIADFFFAGDDSDGDHQSVQSEEPLVSHYMEKMDFETGHEEEEPGDEPLVSHYMEKMDFEGANDDEEPVLK